MKLDKVYPFYFPTTAVFVDDDRDFLLNFSLQLNEELSYVLFDSPQKGQEHIKKQLISHDRRTYFKVLNKTESIHPGAHMFQLSTEDIYKEIYQPNRFQEISVVVVDYSMPGMNGLEFCQSLKKSPIKKILLTGRADESIAIQAFNEGVIDHFIQKNDPKVSQKLEAAIQSLQQAYFAETADVLMQTLSKESYHFLEDPVFVESFQQYCDKHNITEYYLTESPKGFLLADSVGGVHQMLVMEPSDIAVQVAIAKDEDAPDALITQLESGFAVPCFSESDGHYVNGLEEWEDKLYPADIIQGDREYRVSFLKKPITMLEHSKVCFYEAYLDEHDIIAAQNL